ncbi:MAG: PQQ-dependent sugar dehydrogenase [Planctomycetaceae bacterium]|nr:PQQ-dependent sugar dehydrogenase [Planctomycetales bacterium]MCB9941184.1 PQQ-dependent sugar dehydrogenase [Planctomycetaceae bacterium]
MKLAVCASIVGALLALQAVTHVSAEPRAPWTTSRIKGAPDPPSPYSIQPAFPNVSFKNPTCVEEIPGADRLLVTEIGGKIFGVLKNREVHEADLIIDLAESAAGGVRVLDADFHPQFLRNGQIFVCYVHPGDGGHTRVSRFTMSDTSIPTIDPDSEQVIITWPSGGHNGGCLEFGKEGYLYISTGDGSGPNPPDGRTTGQDVTDLLGAVLRIDVDQIQGDRAYVVPSDNPFISLDGARPEVWAYGLRNPFKIGVDSVTGDVFAADNGWETWEMVHKIVRGGNCGWPVMEARAVLRSEVAVGPTPIIPPIKDHSHTEANSVIGGPVYRGRKLPDLVGSFIYGDYITGTIWAVRSEGDGTYSHQTLVDTDQRITSFTEGSKGELYVLDYDYTGRIYELVPSDLPDTSTEFPRRLSETGLFTSTENLQPAPGVVSYDVRVPRWMDGATGERWIAIPGDGSVKLAFADESPVYPEGTVLVKQVNLMSAGDELPIRLETQLLHFERGMWRPYSYLWNDTGTDATLVDSIGADRPLQVADDASMKQDRTWHVSASNECKLCHNAGSQFVLGFVANQLEDQLSALAANKVLSDSPEVPDALQLVNPHDDSQPLDDRARSYLHVNCSMCHHPGGNAIVSFYLRRDLPFDQLNTNKGTGIGTFGMQNAKLIVPGDPYRSVVTYRMSKLGYSRMPYIGSQVVDSAGVALVAKWIRSLDDEPMEDASPPLVSDSAEAKALAIVSDDKSADHDAAIRTLVQSTEGSLALLATMHGGSLSAKDKLAAIAIGNEVSNTNVRGLFETFLPESKRRARLGPNINPETILSQQGDAARGKLIFFSDGARCKACHDVSDPSKSLGTTLVEINKKYKQRGEILQHVLKPSLKIDEPQAAYTVLTTGGQVVVGLLTEKTDEAVVVKTAEQKFVRVPVAEIDEIQRNSTSLMPERILSDLTAQEAADLLEYISSLAANTP